jgi:hypothetical protein
MTDEDKCSWAAKLFYQHITDQNKKNPNFIIDDMAAFAYQWSVNCGFEHPRCFVEYIKDIEADLKLEQLSKRHSE